MEPAFFAMMEEELFMLIPALMSGVPSLLFSVAAWILSSMALYTIARRRGIRSAWLSWIPVANCWILGSLSDQYQYIVKAQNKGKRKILLVLNILMAAFTLSVLVLAVFAVISVIFSSTDAQMMRSINGPVLAILGMCLPLTCVGIAYTVIRFMALFDIYRSLEPGNAVLFLVLSIFFGITEPFFLFFNRNKDGGMPPRKQPVPPQQEPAESCWHSAEEPEETWENQKDYL